MQGLMSSYPLTLTHVFRRAERIFPEKRIATSQGGELVRTTYREWAERTRRLAGVLDALGISADGRVGTFAWNTARHLELYFAAPCSGRVLHTLNIRLFKDDITYIAGHAEDEVIFADRSLLRILWPLVADLEAVKHVVVMDDGDGEVPDDPRVHDYEALLAGAEPVAEFKIDDENRAAAMCYTSGTTGHPKGVVYSHRSIVLHSLGCLVADAAGVSESDTIMPVVPMFHANAWGLCQAAVMAGASLVMPGANMQPKALAELIEAEKVTLAAGVPTIWMGVLPELEGRDLASLREVLCGGSAVPRSLSEAYREQIGLPITQAWGMTETSPVATTGHVKSTLRDRSDDELADLRAAQGLPVPLVDLRIVDPGGDDELPWDGEARGELQAAGPWVAAGYYNDDRSDYSFTDDGWLRTGDVATISANGYVRLVDRTKDLVKSGGEWISSVELENAIMAHPKVAEAAVIGIPDEKWSERPLACVVPAERERHLARRAQGVPHRARAQVVDPGRPRALGRDPEDVGREVLQEDAARAVRGAGGQGACLKVGILGALQVERDGRPVEVAGGRLRALLARLALDAGRPVPVGALVDAVWDNELPADEQHALQSLISRLRRSLGDGDVIAPAPGGYLLAVEPEAVDAHRFERLAAAGAAALRAGDPERAAAGLRDALALWRGPALADLSGQRFAVAAIGLEDLRLTAVVDRAEAELALGRGAALAGELEAAAARASAARAARRAAHRRAVRGRPPGRRAGRLRARARAPRRRAGRRAVARPAGRAPRRAARGCPSPTARRGAATCARR